MVSERDAALVSELLGALQTMDESKIRVTIRMINSLNDFDYYCLPFEPIMKALLADVAPFECSDLLKRVLSGPEFAALSDSHGHLLITGLGSESEILVDLCMSIVEHSLESKNLDLEKHRDVLEAYLLLMRNTEQHMQVIKTIRKNGLEEYVLALNFIPELDKILVLLSGGHPAGWRMAAEYFEACSDDLELAALISEMTAADWDFEKFRMADSADLIKMLLKLLSEKHLLEQTWSFFKRLGLLQSGEMGDNLFALGLGGALEHDETPSALIARGAWAFYKPSLLQPLIEQCFSRNNMDLGNASAVGLCLCPQPETFAACHKLYPLIIEALHSSDDDRQEIARALLSKLLSYEEGLKAAIDGGVVFPFLFDTNCDYSLLEDKRRILDDMLLEDWALSVLGEKLLKEVQQHVKGSYPSRQSKVMVAKETAGG